ncbi:MAG: LuxR C-terminal-related transcriptional regulator [Coriobacteriales bacterium]|jgi:LuxR family maltose regulon positive regulatory protein|nr:LuxR C-terminal-related transcriptional regulator [Coriobacteriales bacterium]
MAERKGVAGPLTRVEGRRVLRRARVDSLLDQALTHPITTIVAGPGYGKSVAVYSYLRESEARAVWVQLSKSDNMPSHFWETFSLAIMSLNQKLATAMANLGFPESDEIRGYFAELLRDEFKLRFHYVLVFDDLHLLEEGPVLDFIVRMSRSLSKGISLVTISRRDNFPIAAELAQAGRLFRIDESELAFTKSEMLEYFEQMAVLPSTEVATGLYYDTEGFPFAVSLAARLLEKNPQDSDYVRTALKGSVHKIIDEQLFALISDDLKHFLLKLSLVKHLSPELIDELQGGQDAMNELANTSSLIRYDQYMHVYRLHHLLLGYLESKQDMLSKEERAEAYAKAAQWCDKNGYRIDALSYYRAMGNYDAIITIASTYPLVMPLDIATELLEAFEQAPKELLHSNPAALILYPRLIMTVGRVDESIALIHEYIALLETRPSSANHDRMLMGLHNALGFAKMITCPETNDFGFAQHFKDAMSYADTAARTSAKGSLVYNVGMYALRLGRAQVGDPEAYIEEVRQSVPCTTITLRGCMHGLESLVRCEYAYFCGQSAEATTHALHCIRDAREYGQVEIECRALYLLLRTYLQMGKYEQIMDVIAQLETLMNAQTFMNRYLFYEVITSWFFAMIGEVNRVESWLKSNLWTSGLNDLVSGMDDFAKLKYYLAIKDYDTLLAFVESRDTSFVVGKIGLMAARAVCYQRLGNQKEALVSLAQTYELARPCGLDMLFIELGNNMRSLTTAALKSSDPVLSGVSTEWLETIRSRATTYAKRVAFVRSRYLEAHSSSADVQLTTKELEILTDLTHGLSRTEISVARGVSINTVKSMLTMIYEKLGAENAIDAIRLATTKQLL